MTETATLPGLETVDAPVPEGEPSAGSSAARRSG